MLPNYDDPSVDLLGLLDLERIEQDLFRANTVFREISFPGSGQMVALYGGQVAAQALRAAGLTVDPDRHPHSLHGYFLRPGDSRLPTVFTVYRDRDGRSYSARRVVAIQNGKVIFNMSASFQVGNDQPVEQLERMPEVLPADDLREGGLDRLVSMSVRCPEQPYDRAIWPTRFWARVVPDLPADPLVQACALAYLSDISAGVLPAADGSARPSSSLDHALWFHEPADLNEWVLSDYQPRVTGHGRGWYTGSIFDRSGNLLASLAQETLFR
ncbi:MAG: acyl-CoA thioesterase domain-containing protein [Jatrophihabitans sp.]